MILVVDDADWADRPSLVALTSPYAGCRLTTSSSLFVLRDFIEAQLRKA